MKKIAKFFLAAIAVSAAASCAKEMIPSNNANQGPADGFVCITLEAEMDDITKAASLGNDLSVKWEVGDEVAVYDTIATAANKFTVSDIQGSKIKMTGTISKGALRYVAVYPYSAAAAYDKKTDVVKVNIPSLQSIPSGKNIDPAALVSVSRAKDGETLKFNNVVSLVKFNIAKSGVQSVCFKGNNDEAINGTTTPSADLKTFTATSTQLTVVPAAGGEIAAGDYYATIAPDTLKAGFKVSTMTADYTLTVKTANNQAIFKRNSGLNIGSWTGGTEVPSTITTKEQLVTFAANCDMYPYTATIKLGADINVNGNWTTAKPFYGNFDGQNHKIYNVKATSAGAYYVGIFSVLGDGTNPASVKNLCVGSSDYDFNGKTGTYDGESEFILESVDPDKKKIYSYGGIVAKADNNCVIENVTNYSTIEANADGTAIHVAAGVVGDMKGTTVVRNCCNYGDIKDNAGTLPDSSPMGGVIGWYSSGKDGLVTSCHNYGEITINGININSIGGVLGRIHGTGFFENCENHANININTKNCPYHSYYGGITGYCPTPSSFKGCKNFGKITCNDVKVLGLGGIIGCTWNTNGTVTLENCENKGTLEVNAVTNAGYYPSIGGIIGRNGHDTGKTSVLVVKNCKNTEEINVQPTNAFGSKNLYVGGIIGFNGSAGTSESSISDCTNEGAITVAPEQATGLRVEIGGIIAYHDSPKCVVTNCKNTGALTKGGKAQRTNIGGIFASVNANAKNSTVNKCSNEGIISSCSVDSGATQYSYFGGLVGWSDGNASITYTDCHNTAEVKIEGPLSIGATYTAGLVGFLGAAGIMKECTNSGDITPCYEVDTETETVMEQIGAGGLCARVAGTLENCSNSGNIYCNPGSQLLKIYIGGIASGLDAAKLIKDCSNTGNISIMGCTTTNDCTIGSFLGRLNLGTKLTGNNSTKGQIEIGDNVTSQKIFVGGLCGDQSVNTTATADVTISAECSVDVTIKTPEVVKPRTGLVIGAWRSGTPKVTTIGTTENPVKAKGSINGVTATKDNFTTMAQGSASVTTNCVLNAVLAE